MYVDAHACIYISTHIINIFVYYTYVQTLDPHHIKLINVSVCIYICMCTHTKNVNKFIVYKSTKMHTNILYIIYTNNQCQPPPIPYKNVCKCMIFKCIKIP